MDFGRSGYTPSAFISSLPTGPIVVPVWGSYGSFRKLGVPYFGASWSVPRLKEKSTIPPWVSQVLHCRDHPGSPFDTSISCITQKPLSEWVKLDLGQIRSFIAQPGLRFLAARKRYGVLRQSILDFYKDQLLGNSRRSHVVKPDWTMDFRCFVVTRVSISLVTRAT